MNRELVRRVWLRAGSRCEYCKVHASLYPAAFPINRIIAKQHGGATDLSNLALSCLHCSARKGPNIAGIDPLTGNVTRLFHPRNDSWAEHFLLKAGEISGRTEVGRTTIMVLAVNEPGFLEVRVEFSREGTFE